MVKSARTLILEAIAEKANSIEQRMDFYVTADARFTGIAETGEIISWEATRSYLKARMAGKSAARPKPRSLNR